MERPDQVYLDIMNELMTDCPEDCVPYLSRCLSIIQERYVFVLKNYPDVDAECMEIILRNTWIPLEVEQVYFHDIPTFLHYIFVNRTEYHNLSSSQYIKFQVEMDLFHKLINLIDKNSSVIPEGDYIEMCKTIKELHEKVKPPPFLLDQNEPMAMPIYEPTQMTPHEQAELMEDIRLMRERERAEFMEALQQVSQMVA